MAKRTAKDIDAEIAKIGTLDMGGNGGGTSLRTIARDDGWGVYAKDAVYHLGRGASGLIRGAAAIGDEAANGLSRRFTGKDAGPGFSKIANPLMNGFEKGISGLRSATDQLDEEDMQEAIQASKDRGEDWTGQTAAAIRSTGLRGASLMAIEQVPGLAPGVGIQKLVRGGMAIAGKGATKAGVNLSAKNTARVKALSGMGEAAIGNAAQSYLSNAGEVVQDNLENGRQWDKGLGELKKGLYVSAGIGALEHKLGVRAESAIVNRMGSKMSGGAGAAVNSAPVPKGGLAKRAFGTVKNGVKGAVGGAASEGYTSYSEQKDINRALGRDENDDLGMAVYQGILGGAAFGGGTKMMGQDRPYHQKNVPITPNTTHDLLGGNPPPSGGSGPGKAVATANNVLDSIDRAAGDTDGETSAAVKIVREAANANPAVAEVAAKCRSAEDVRSLAEQIKEATRQPQPQAPTAEGQGQALPAGNPAPQQNMPGANRPQVAPQPGDAQQAVAQSAPPQAKEINSLNELDQMGFDEVSTLAGGIQDKDGSAVKAFSQLDDDQKLTLKAVAAGASAAGKKISGADLVAQASKYKSPQEHLDALNKRINDIATTSVPGGKSDSSALASAIAERAVLTGKCEANPQAVQSYLYGKDGVMHMAQSIQESIVNAQNLRARAEKAVQKAATKLQDAKIKLNAAKISKDEKKIAAAQAEFVQAEAELAAAKGAAEENRAAVAEGQNKLTEFLASISGETQAPKPQEATPAEPQKAIPATAEGPTEQSQAAPAEQKAETPAEPTQAIPTTPEPEAPAEQTPKAPAEPEAEADTGTQPRALPIAEGRAILMEPERASDNAENDAYEAKHESSNYVPPSQKAARAKWESDKSNAARRTAAEDDANASSNSLEAKQDSLSPYNQSVAAAKKKRAAGKKQHEENTKRHKEHKAKAEEHRQRKAANNAKRGAVLTGLEHRQNKVAQEEQRTAGFSNLANTLVGVVEKKNQARWAADQSNAATRAASEEAANAENDAYDAAHDSMTSINKAKAAADQEKAQKQSEAQAKWETDKKAAKARSIIDTVNKTLKEKADKAKSEREKAAAEREVEANNLIAHAIAKAESTSQRELSNAVRKRANAEETVRQVSKQLGRDFTQLGTLQEQINAALGAVGQQMHEEQTARHEEHKAKAEEHRQRKAEREAEKKAKQEAQQAAIAKWEADKQAAQQEQAAKRAASLSNLASVFKAVGEKKAAQQSAQQAAAEKWDADKQAAQQRVAEAAEKAKAETKLVFNDLLDQVPELVSGGLTNGKPMMKQLLVKRQVASSIMLVQRITDAANSLQGLTGTAKTAVTKAVHNAVNSAKGSVTSAMAETSEAKPKNIAEQDAQPKYTESAPASKSSTPKIAPPRAKLRAPEGSTEAMRRAAAFKQHFNTLQSAVSQIARQLVPSDLTRLDARADIAQRMKTAQTAQAAAEALVREAKATKGTDAGISNGVVWIDARNHAATVEEAARLQIAVDNIVNAWKADTAAWKKSHDAKAAAEQAAVEKWDADKQAAQKRVATEAEEEYNRIHNRTLAAMEAAQKALDASKNIQREVKNETSKRPEKAGGKERIEGANSTKQEQHPAKQVQPADAGERAARNPQPGERSAGGEKRNPVEPHEPGNRADGTGSVPDAKASGRNREEAPRKGKVVKANRTPSAYTRATTAFKSGDVEATKAAVKEYFDNLPAGKKPATQMIKLRNSLEAMESDLFSKPANGKPEGPDDTPPRGGAPKPRSGKKPSAQARARVATTKAKTANVPKKAEGAAAPKGQKSISSGEGRSTAESVRSELSSDPASKGVTKLVDNGTLNIVDREADLPDTVEKDGRTGGYYDPSTGKAYLVAENIAPGDARGVLLHEVGNHMVHDESMAPLDKRACLLVEDGVKRGDPLMQRVADRLKAAGETISSNPQETRAYLTEEAAKMVKPPRGVLGFFRQMKAAVNAWMTKHVGNVPGFRLSPEDMVRIAEAGVQKAAEGKRNISGQIQFSKAMTVTPEMRSVKEVADDGLAKKVLSGKEDWAYALERGLNDRARRTINALPISDKAKFAVSKIADMIGKGMKTGLNAVFTRDLVQMAREFMPSAQRWYDTQIAKQNIKNSMMESAKYVQECFYQGVHSHEEREAAYRFMADVTYNQVWWTSKRPNWVDEHQWMRYVSLSSEPYTKADGTEGKRFTEEKRKAFEKAKAAWESMSDAQRTAVEEYFKWTYSAKRKEIEALEQLNRDTTHKLLEQIDMKIREAGGALARTSGEKEIKKAEARMKKLRAERAALANRFKDIPKMIESEVSVLAAPYAPLRRLGDHLIIGKSKEYLGLENKLKSLEQRHKDSPESYTNEDAAEAKSIREQLEEMKGDGKHYWLDSEDGAFSSRNKMDALQKANPNLVFSEPFPVSEASDRGVIRINQLKNVIDQAAIDMDDLGVDGDTKDYIMGLSKAANELMVKSMLNSAIQKSQLKRNNVMGFDTNMMRVFDEYSIRQANHVATLCTERAQRSAMSSMIKEKKTAPEERREYCTDLYNQIQRRTELLAKQDPQHWANKVQRFNAGMMLFTNPGYYFQNATQPFMMSASYMAGNFGMTKMTTEIGQVYGQLVKNFSGYFGKPWKLDDLVKDGVCNQEELAMLKQLNYENLLEASMQSEYGELNDSESWMARKYKLVSDKFVAINQRVEMMNRISTALVAYRNAKGSDKVRGMKDAYKNSIVSKQFKGDMDAYAYAAEVVYRTHGDYSSLNSPAMMLQGGIHAGGLEKLLFQFRKYQLIQIGSYAHMLKKAFNGATPEERALGKREFLYTMGTNLAMCGLKGSFLLAQLMFLGNWAFGDDDETDEEWTKRMLGNGTAADILVGGLPEFAGLPVSSYIGAGEALSPFGFFRRHDGPGGVGFVEDLAFAAGGPTLSQADKMVRGFGNMWDATNIVTDYELDPYFKAGQFTKGLETVLPKGFGNAVKAVDQMVNGISSSTGNTQYLSPDEITYWDTFCTAMGIPSSHVSEAYETTGRNYEKLNLLKDKTSEVKGFIKSGDYEAAKRAIIRRNNLALKLNKKPKYYADYVKEIRAAEKRKASM